MRIPAAVLLTAAFAAALTVGPASRGAAVFYGSASPELGAPSVAPDPARIARPVDGRGLVAYARGCGELAAADLRAPSRPFPIADGPNACAATWAPGGVLVIREQRLGGRGGDDVVLVGADGVRSPVGRRGESPSGPVAFAADGSLYYCAVQPRWPYAPHVVVARAGAAMRVVARGCGPTIAADGTLAYTGGVEISRFGTYVTTDVRIANWAGSRRLRAYHDRLITGLAFTGSSRLLIATTAGVAGGAVDAIARDGRGRRIAVIGRGSLSAWPAPRGELVLVARNLPDGSGSVRLAEASSGATRWLLPTTGPAQVAWSPDARTLLLADRVSWRVVAVATGTVKRRLAPLGREPSWCCPDPPADPVIRLHVAGWHTGVAHS